MPSMAIFWTVEDMTLFFYQHVQQKCEFLQPSEMPNRTYLVVMIEAPMMQVWLLEMKLMMPWQPVRAR